jgi:hypothetical protein
MAQEGWIVANTAVMAMTPADYVVPAARVVEELKGNLRCRGESREHHAPLSRADLMVRLGLLRRNSRSVRPLDLAALSSKFGQQLQHMQRHHYAEHRISFQHYPTGWIYDPPRKNDVVVEVKCRLPDGKVITAGQKVVGPNREDFSLTIPHEAQATHVAENKQRTMADVEADIEIVWQWASKQWVPDGVRHALERLRKASR